jgi:hypothetical protein
MVKKLRDCWRGDNAISRVMSSDLASGDIEGNKFQKENLAAGIRTCVPKASVRTTCRSAA